MAESLLIGSAIAAGFGMIGVMESGDSSAIHLLLFGPMAEAAKTRSLAVPIYGDGITCAQLRERAAAACPALGRLLPACRFAVNQVFVDDAYMVSPADEVALIGMVSGG